MKNYNELLESIMKNGVDREGRNGWTRALFAQQLRFKMSDGFPAVTTKKLAFRTMAAELLCFISGVSDNKEFNRLGCHIWDDNANACYWKPKAKFEGDLGRIYGVQWRSWNKFKNADMGDQHGSQESNTFFEKEPFDQLKDVIDRIKKDPHDRRLIVTAWNPGELGEMALPPCHMMFQFFCADRKISLHMIQRSCDMFLGVPFNIASYALLLHLVAQITGMIADEVVITFNDAHIYQAHFDAVKEQLSREPFVLPKLYLNPKIKNLENLDTGKIKDPADILSICKLENYQHHPEIKAPMIV